MDGKDPYSVPVTAPKAKIAPTPLPPDAEARVISEARREGIFAGLTSGLASAIVGQRLMGFNRNKTLICGTLSSLLAGYYFTQAFTSTAISQLRAVEAQLSSGPHSSPENPHPETQTQEK